MFGFTAKYKNDKGTTINYFFFAKNLKEARKYRRRNFSAKYVRIIQED